MKPFDPHGVHLEQFLDDVALRVIKVTAGASEADVPDRFLTGDAWLEHYTEEAYEGAEKVAPLD